MSEVKRPVGFIGLGNMGGPMAANVAKAGHSMLVFDKAGTKARAPEGARIAGGVGEVAAQSEVVILSLPDGKISAAVAEEVLASNSRVVRTLVDTSTIGVAFAREIEGRCREGKLEYVDAPVSGGTAGAKAGTIALMYAGSAETLARLRPVLSAMSKNIFHVGDKPGQGQAMKVLNNFLSATAMAATSEGISFGLTQGLEMSTMIDVLNASSGQNTATSDKFKNRIQHGRYDAGFLNNLLLKDISLYLEGARGAGVAKDMSETLVAVWKRFVEAEPGVDFTRIFPFIKDKR